MSKLKKIILAALFLALNIVLSRFLSIKTPIIVIKFSFIPTILSAIMLGPWWTMLISGLADLIGALLFPTGAYFVGYTISAVLAGFIYGIFLHRKKPISNMQFLWRLIVSIACVIILCNSILNSLWIWITTQKAMFAILPTRLIKQAIMLPIEVLVMFFLNLGLEKAKVYSKFLGETPQVEEETENDKT